MNKTVAASSLKNTNLQIGERVSNYRVVALDGNPTMLFKSEVEAVMDWDVEDAKVLDGDDRFTHMERLNKRTGEWKTVVAWDPKFAVYADESANVML
jgi:hypothetical protein